MVKRNLSKKMLMATLIAATAIATTQGANATDVANWSDLSTALQAGTSDIVVTGNIADATTVEVYGKTNTVNLNGKTLSGQGSATTSSMIFGGGSLTLNGGGTISGFYRPDTNPVKVDGSEFGIIDLRNNSNLTITGENDDWTFSGNTSGVGSINALNSSISANVDKIVFDSNISNAQGAGFRHQISDNTYIDNSASIVANEIIFNNNEIKTVGELGTAVVGGGGAVMNSGGTMELLGGENTFTNNKMNATIAEGRRYKVGGGAVINQSHQMGSGAAINSTMAIGDNNTISNTFTGNTSSTNGGAIMNRAVDEDGNATLTITGATNTFSNNTATLNGGAIYNIAQNEGETIERVAALTINGDTTFSGNKAGGLGGAIYNAGDMTLDGDFTFSNNYQAWTGETGTKNDIYNTGNLIIKGGTVTFDGGIAGEGGTIDIQSNVNFAGDSDIVQDSLKVESGQTLTIGEDSTLTTSKLEGAGTLKNEGHIELTLAADTDYTLANLIDGSATPADKTGTTEITVATGNSVTLAPTSFSQDTLITKGAGHLTLSGANGYAVNTLENQMTGDTLDIDSTISGDFVNDAESHARLITNGAITGAITNEGTFDIQKTYALSKGIADNATTPTGTLNIGDSANDVNVTLTLTEGYAIAQKTINVDNDSTLLNQGTVTVYDTLGLAAESGTKNVGTINNDGSTTALNLYGADMTNAGLITGSGTVKIGNGTAASKLTNNGEMSGNISISALAELETKADTVTDTDGIANDGTLTINNAKLANGTFGNNVSGDGHTDIAGDDVKFGSAVISQAINIKTGAKLTTTADNIQGAVDNSNSLVLTGGALSDAAYTVSGTGSTTIDGIVGSSASISNAGGITILAATTADPTAASQLTIGASNVGVAVTNEGTLTLTDGTLSKTVTGTAGSTVIDGTVTSSASIGGAGISILSATTDDPTVASQLTIGASNVGAAVTNGGTLTLTDGTLSKTVTGATGTTNITGFVTSNNNITQATVNVGTDDGLGTVVPANLTNSAAIAANVVVNNDSTLTNNATGIIGYADPADIPAAATPPTGYTLTNGTGATTTNKGTINVDAIGTWGQFTNDTGATINANSIEITFDGTENTGILTNKGTVNSDVNVLAGATFENSGTASVVSTGKTVANYGNTVNEGTMYQVANYTANSEFVNKGTVTYYTQNNGGTVYNSGELGGSFIDNYSNGTIYNYLVDENGDKIENSDGTLTGGIENTAGSTIVTIAGGLAGNKYIMNDGTIQLTDGTLNRNIAKHTTAGAGTVEIAGDVAIGATTTITDNTITLTSGTFDVTAKADSTGNIAATTFGSGLIANGGTLNVQDGKYGTITLGEVNTDASALNVVIDAQFATGERDENDLFIGSSDKISGSVTDANNKIQISKIVIGADPKATEFATQIAYDATSAAAIDVTATALDGLSGAAGSILLSYDSDSSSAYYGYLKGKHEDLANAITSTIENKMFSMGASDTIDDLDLGGKSLAITTNGYNISSTSGDNSKDGINIVANTQTLSIIGTAVDPNTENTTISGFDTAIDNTVGGTVNLTDVTMTGNTTDVINDGEGEKGLFLAGTNAIDTIKDSAGTGAKGQTTITAGTSTIGSLIQKDTTVADGATLNIGADKFNVKNGLTNNGTLNLTGGDDAEHSATTLSKVLGTGTTYIDKFVTTGVGKNIKQDALVINEDATLTNSEGTRINVKETTISANAILDNQGKIVSVDTDPNNKVTVNGTLINGNVTDGYKEATAVGADIVNNGTVDNYSRITSNSTITNNAGAVLHNYANADPEKNAVIGADITNSGTVYNDALINDNGDITNKNGGIVHNNATGTIQGAVDNEAGGVVNNVGLIEGAITNAAAAGETPAGIVNTTASGFKGGMDNDGIANLTGSATDTPDELGSGITGDGTTNIAGNVTTHNTPNDMDYSITQGAIVVGSDGTDPADATLTNTGTITAGTITTAKDATHTGTLANEGTVIATTSIDNNGAITNAAGAVIKGSVGNDPATINNGGSISNAAATTDPAADAGSIIANITNDVAGASIDNAGTITGNITNTENLDNITIANSGTVTGDVDNGNGEHNVINNSGTIGTDENNTLTNNGGTVNNYITDGDDKNYGTIAAAIDNKAGTVNTNASGFTGGMTNDGTANIVGTDPAAAESLGSAISNGTNGTGVANIAGNVTSAYNIAQAELNIEENAIFTNEAGAKVDAANTTVAEDAELNNQGVFSSANGTNNKITVAEDATLNNGTPETTGTSTARIGADIENSGTVNNYDVIRNTSTITNNAGAELNNLGSGRIGADINNSGTVNNDNLINDNSTVTNNAGGVINNTKDSSLIEGAITNAAASADPEIAAGIINTTAKGFTGGLDNDGVANLIGSADPEAPQGLGSDITGDGTTNIAGDVTTKNGDTNKNITQGTVNVGASGLDDDGNPVVAAGSLTNEGGTIIADDIVISEEGTLNQTAGAIGDAGDPSGDPPVPATPADITNSGTANITGGTVTADDIYTEDGAQTNIGGTAEVAADDITTSGVYVDPESGEETAAATNITGGTVTADEIYTEYGAQTNISGGEVTADTIESEDAGSATNITGGTVTADDINAWDGAETNISGTADVTAGDIYADNATTNISGGEVDADTITNSDDATTNITGGDVTAGSIDNIGDGTVIIDQVEKDAEGHHVIDPDTGLPVSTGSVVADAITNQDEGTTEISSVVQADTIASTGDGGNIIVNANDGQTATSDLLKDKAGTGASTISTGTDNTGTGTVAINTDSDNMTLDNNVTGNDTANGGLELIGNQGTAGTASDPGTVFDVAQGTTIDSAKVTLEQGQLNLPDEDAVLTGDSQLEVADGATLNTMNESTKPYDQITLDNDSQVKVDVNALSGKADNFADGTQVNEGDGVTMTDLSLQDLNKIVHLNTNINLAKATNLQNLTIGDELLNKKFRAMTPIRIMEATINENGMLNIHPSSGRNDYNSFNPSVVTGIIAAQLGGYLSQLNSYDEAFRNVDMKMLMTQEERKAMKLANSYASEVQPRVFSPTYLPEKESAGWFRPYASFEKVGLKYGPRAGNIMYGSFFGGDSKMYETQNGWDYQYSVYIGYNGSHQTWAGNSIYQNGGNIGATGVWYKGDFFTALTANVGASVADASTFYGSEDFPMLMAGVASKSGYNWELAKGKFIIQPSFLMSYTFVNTYGYTNAAGVRITSDPLNAINMAPGLKFIGNLKHGWQPYAGVQMVWNIMDKADFRANDIPLPEMSVKPYFQYGVGVQKRWGERFTGFFQAMLRNGGRNGIALSAGFRWAIGKGASSSKSGTSSKKTEVKRSGKTSQVTTNPVKKSQSLWSRFWAKADNETIGSNS